MTGLGERSHLMSKDVVLDTHIADIVNVIEWEDLAGICLVDAALLAAVQISVLILIQFLYPASATTYWPSSVTFVF